MSCESDTAAVLRAAGQRVTPQRILILGCVRHAGGHVTAAQILDEVRRSFPYIDASTVYRTLAAAKERRLVSEVNLGGGEDLFEWVGSDRHHRLICRVCGQVSSLEEAYPGRQNYNGGAPYLLLRPPPCPTAGRVCRQCRE